MKKTIFILTAVITTLTLFSCASVKEIPQDKSAAQILQLGQNAATMVSYSGAEICYKTAVERFGQFTSLDQEEEIKVFIEATYELGHIYYKQKKYDEAKNCFNEVLSIYNEVGFASPIRLDPSYKKLCENSLARIDEVTKIKK